MAERYVDGPEKDYLTATEAAAWLGLDADDFQEFVRLGYIPRGIPYGKRASRHRWHWLDVVAFAHLAARGFLRLPGAEEGPEKTG